MVHGSLYCCDHVAFRWSNAEWNVYIWSHFEEPRFGFLLWCETLEKFRMNLNEHPESAVTNEPYPSMNGMNT